MTEALDDISNRDESIADGEQAVDVDSHSAGNIRFLTYFGYDLDAHEHGKCGVPIFILLNKSIEVPPVLLRNKLIWNV